VRCHVSKDHRETFLVMMAFLKKHNADNQFEHRIRPFKKFIDTSMLQCLRVFKKTKSQDERHFFDKHKDSSSIIMNTDEVGMYINHKNMGPEMKALFADQILATYSATETGKEMFGEVVQSLGVAKLRRDLQVEMMKVRHAPRLTQQIYSEAEANMLQIFKAAQTAPELKRPRICTTSLHGEDAVRRSRCWATWTRTTRTSSRTPSTTRVWGTA
jgi:hypothetical protein